MNRAYLICENGWALKFYTTLPNGGILIHSFERFRREYNAWSQILKVSRALNEELMLQTAFTRLKSSRSSDSTAVSAETEEPGLITMAWF